MIGTLLWVNWKNLIRDRVALGLTFALPILFFSIFAGIFAGMGGGRGDDGAVPALGVLLLDDDRTEASRRLVAALDSESQIEMLNLPSDPSGMDQKQVPSVERAPRLVRSGRYDAALIIPSGFGDNFPDFARQGPPVQIIYDSANPMAEPTLAGMLQGAAMSSMPELMIEHGFSRLENVGWTFTPDQQRILDQLTDALRGRRDWESFGSSAESAEDTAPPEADETGEANSDPTDEAAGGFAGPIRIEASPARDAQQDDAQAGHRQSAQIAYYAAGIGVMFLLFSMAGAAGSLLAEEESGTIERLLSSDMTMGCLLTGHWLFYALMGVAQVTLMFVWGALVFGLDLWTANHLVGFLIMTLVTAAAAAALGIMLATICRSRGQLSGISTIVILVMSAAGGSMVPRFIMPDAMQKLSLVTFNGWALEGYLNVFWYDDPTDTLLASMTPLALPVGVLVALAIVFLLIARQLARRWERI